MDEEMEETTERPARRRVVESRREHSGLSLGTQFMLVLGTALVVAVIIVLWVSQRIISPTVRHVTDTLGSYGWLWTLLLIITAIGAAIGLLRRFGLVKFIEDVVLLGLRVHKHVVESKRLQPDKLGNFPYMIGDDGYPIVVPSGNPAHAQVMPPMPSMGIGSRRANAKTTVEAEMQPVPQTGMQQVGTAQSPLGLNGPGQQANAQNVQTIKFDKVGWGAGWEQSDAYERKELPGRYNFIDELAMFQPTPERIFMGRSVNGPVIVPFGLHGHIVFAGPTRVGKSTILRMLYGQFVAINVDCYLCDPHYIPVNTETGVDWTPIERLLARPPFRKPKETADFLKWAATKLLEVRKDRAYRGHPLGRPVVVGIEELAAVIDADPEAARYIGLLLREGLKYLIVVVLAAQDLLVQSIGLDSGMIENILTGYYGGGDQRTEKIALNLANGEQKNIDENGLGNGVVYLRTYNQPAVRVRIPWPDNDATQALCSMSYLPVHELVREPLAETDMQDDVYRPENEIEQVANNIREFPTVASPKQEDPLDPRILEEARKVKLSDRAFAEHAGITKYQANRYNNRVRELEAEQQKALPVDG